MAARSGSLRSIQSGSISRRATLVLGSRWVVIPATISVRRRSGQRTAKWSAVIAPIEKPSRWKVASPSASAKAATSSTSWVYDHPSAASQRVVAWPRASGRKTRKAFEKSGTWAAKSSRPAEVAPWSMISGGPAPWTS